MNKASLVVEVAKVVGSVPFNLNLRVFPDGGFQLFYFLAGNAQRC